MSRLAKVAVLIVCALAAPGVASAADRAPRVVGGTDVPPGALGAVANVAIAGAFGCTGTLVAPDWVLTAGHCGSLTGAAVATPIGLPGQLVTVTLGTVRADGAGGETITADRVVPHPRYLLTQGYDIALVHLARRSVQTPVTIAGIGQEGLWVPGAPVTIAGFGVTSEGGEAPAVMQQARVAVVADPDCARAYGTFEARTQLCAGLPQGGVDSCQGDSGGPLLAARADGAVKIVGATSYGEGCGQAGRPGVYARIADTELRTWLASQVPSAVDGPYVAPAPPAKKAKAKAPKAKAKKAKTKKRAKRKPRRPAASRPSRR